MIGNALIFFSVIIVVKTLYQPIVQEIKFFSDKENNKKYVVVDSAKKDKVNFLKTFDNVGNVEILQPEDPYFSIIIPKIGANSKVIPNIDPSNENIYLPALEKGVAHALGTAFPGEGGHVFLFAHSTDYFWNVNNYNAVFYLLYKLEFNDEIDLFYKNQRIAYRVLDKKVVDPSEIEYLTKKTDGEFLTLQTCWPLGTTLKRLMVFAERIRN
jgi:sortase A